MMPADLRIKKYNQRLTLVDANAAYQVMQFPGPSIDPILVKQPKNLIIVTQSGEAEIWGGYMQPTPPLESLRLIAQSPTSRSRDGLVGKTTWEYTFAIPAADYEDAIWTETVLWAPSHAIVFEAFA